MKKLNLNVLCDALGIICEQKDVNIKKITTTMNDIDNETLVFHLEKTIELNKTKLEKCHHCYIITDQPLLNDAHHLQHHFLYVYDIGKTYQQFIDYYRNQFHLPVVSVTGTCGKTTTKEMIKQMLAYDHKVTGTILSKNAIRFNHDYLLSIDETTEYGVYETALTHPGNIIYSCHFFQPTIGVITNIGIDHLNECKTLDNYIRTKGEMLAGLRYKGTLIINGDDENIKKIDFTPFKGIIKTFGLAETNDFYAKSIIHKNKGISFTLVHKGNEYEAYVPGFGVHNVYNALAALAVIETLGKDLNKVIYHLARFTHVESHLESHKGINDSLLIDDTWSSNPTSVKAAFEAFKDRKETKIAVLGQIAYLGDHVVEQCREMGKMIVDYGIDYVVTKDAFSRLIGKEAIKFGMDSSKVFNCRSDAEVKAVLEKLLQKKTIAIFKVSMFDKSMISIMKHFIVD